MNRNDVTTFVRALAGRERALARATRQRLGLATTPASEEALRSDLADLIATLREVLPKLADDALKAELMDKIARHEAHLTRMTPCAEG